MASNKSIFLMIVIMAVVMMININNGAEAQIACKDVSSKLTPCLNYVKGGGSVPADCCAGVRSLRGLAKTPADRKSVCNCLKNSLKNVKNIQSDLLSGLPAKCKVNLPYRISTTTNCNSVN